MQILRFLVLFTVFTVSSSTSYAAPAEMKVPADLIGTWSLQTFDIIDKDGKKTPWCEGLTGLLTYNKNGYMSAAINCAKTSDQSPARAYDNQLFYAGQYSMTSGPAVIHHVMNASKSSIIGTDLLRKIAHLDKNNLTLTGDFGGNFSIVWTKAQTKPAE